MASTTSGQVNAGTMTVRLPLRTFNVSRMTMRQAVPEHSTPTFATRRKSASTSVSGPGDGPTKSPYESGRPAVGGSSILDTGCRVRGFRHGEADDTGNDASATRSLSEGKGFAEYRPRKRHDADDFKVGRRESRADGRML